MFADLLQRICTAMLMASAGPVRGSAEDGICFAGPFWVFREVGIIPEVGDEKPIGRRAFLGLMVAGAAAFAFGREDFWASHERAGHERLDAGDVRPGDRPIDVAAATISGLVENPLKLAYDQLLALPSAEATGDFRCVDGWQVQSRRWKGVRLRELLDRAVVDPSATHVVFYSGISTYTDSLPVSSEAAPMVCCWRTR